MHSLLWQPLLLSRICPLPRIPGRDVRSKRHHLYVVVRAENEAISAYHTGPALSGTIKADGHSHPLPQPGTIALPERGIGNFLTSISSFSGALTLPSLESQGVIPAFQASSLTEAELLQRRFSCSHCSARGLPSTCTFGSYQLPHLEHTLGGLRSHIFGSRLDSNGSQRYGK